jgi:hypothetical protein
VGKAKSLLLIIFALLATAAVIYTDRVWPASPPSAPRLTPPPPVATVAPKAPTPTPVWKNYKNPKLGFSLDYPSGDNFVFETLDSESKDQLLFLHIYPGSRQSQSYINIEVYTGDRTLLPAGPTPNPLSYPNVISTYKRTTVGKLEFEDYVIKGDCRPHTMQIVHNNKTYVFQEICAAFPEFATLLASLKFN